MDLLTHGVFGAALAAGVARRGEIRVAATVGFLAGLLPDADTFIQTGTDPLLVLDYHRHFTHALAFMPVGALIAALLTWPFARRYTRFGRLYLYALLGYALAPLMDACTSYGTHLWWPFSERQAAWGFIAVFDPLFSLAVAISLWLGWRQQRTGWMHLGLALAAIYLGIGALQHFRVAEQAMLLAQSRGHHPDHIHIKPTLANLLLWRSVYRFDGQVYADAHRAGLAEVRIYPGQQMPVLTEVQALAWTGGDPALQRDLERFRKFSDGYVVLDTAQPAFIGDARYAMLPHTLVPIWGIEKQPGATLPRIQFVTRRDTGVQVRTTFLDMLLGRR
jgi:inner membrane protein